MNAVRTILGSVMLALASLEAGASPVVYIPLGDASRIQVVDAASSRVIGVIEDVGNAHGLAITPDGRTLVAGSFTEGPAGTTTTPPRPAGVSQSEHEKHHATSPGDVHASAPSAASSHVSVIDADSRKVVRRVAVRGAVHHVAISPDGRFAVTTHPGWGGVSAIDLRRFAVVAEVATGTAPNYAAFSPDGGKVYVSDTGDDRVSEIDVSTWSVARQFDSGRAPEHLVLSEDGRTLYTSNVADGTATVISLARGTVTDTFAIGTSPHGIDLSDDGATLFATSNGDETLVAIDLASGERRAVALAPAPYHLTAVRGTGTLYVSSRAEKRVWVVDQRSLETRAELALGGIGHQMAIATP